MKVISSRTSRKSGRVLEQALSEAGYDGPKIVWGYSGSSCREGVLNPPGAVALATNKRLALRAMREAGVPTLYVGLNEDWEYPVVARPDFHRAG